MLPRTICGTQSSPRATTTRWQHRVQVEADAAALTVGRSAQMKILEDNPIPLSLQAQRFVSEAVYAKEKIHGLVVSSRIQDSSPSRDAVVHGDSESPDAEPERKASPHGQVFAGHPRSSRRSNAPCQSTVVVVEAGHSLRPAAARSSCAASSAARALPPPPRARRRAAQASRTRAAARASSRSASHSASRYASRYDREQAREQAAFAFRRCACCTCSSG